MEEYHGDLETKLVLNLIFCKSFKICVLSIDWLISHELAKKMSCGKSTGEYGERKRERERYINPTSLFRNSSFSCHFALEGAGA